MIITVCSRTRCTTDILEPALRNTTSLDPGGINIRMSPAEATLHPAEDLDFNFPARIEVALVGLIEIGGGSIWVAR